jgi:hypothetical protein
VAKLGLVAAATVAVAAAPAAIHVTRAREATAKDAAAPFIQDAPAAALPQAGGANGQAVPRDPAPARVDRPGAIILAGAHPSQPPETTTPSGTRDESAVSDAAQADDSEPPPEPEADPTAEADPTPQTDPAAAVDATPADATDPAADAPVDTTPADSTDPAAPPDAPAADPALGG